MLLGCTGPYCTQLAQGRGTLKSIWRQKAGAPATQRRPAANKLQQPYLKVGLRSFSITLGSWLVTFLPNSSTTRGCRARRGWGMGWEEAAMST